MTSYARYRYIGDVNPYDVEHGKSYKLAIYKLSLFERVFGKYPIGWRVIVYRPFDCNTAIMHYSSRYEFENDWAKVKTRQQPNKSLILTH